MRTSKSVDVERAMLEDIPALVELKIAMFAEAGHAKLLPEQKRSVVCEDYERMYRDDIAAHFVVRREDRIVACAGAFLKSDLPYRYFSPPVYGFIGDVYTLPSARGNGFARALSEAAVTWLSSRGVSAVRLLASEAARPIYSAMGFQPTDEMVLHLPAAGECAADAS